MTEQLPPINTGEDITKSEGNLLFDRDRKTKIPSMPSIASQIEQEQSAMSVSSIVELQKDLSTPTKIKNSKSHKLLMRDMALSNYPTFEYAEMMAKFFKAAGYFLEMGYPKVAAMIIYDRQNIEWSLQGVQFGLRRENSSSRAYIERKDDVKQTQQQQGGGLNFNPKNLIR